MEMIASNIFTKFEYLDDVARSPVASRSTANRIRVVRHSRTFLHLASSKYHRAATASTKNRFEDAQRRLLAYLGWARYQSVEKPPALRATGPDRLCKAPLSGPPSTILCPPRGKVREKQRKRSGSAAFLPLAALVRKDVQLNRRDGQKRWDLKRRAA